MPEDTVVTDKQLDGAMATVSIQLGAVERILGEKIKALRWQMVAALVGGQAIAGLLAAIVTRNVETPARVGAAALRAIGLL